MRSYWRSVFLSTRRALSSAVLLLIVQISIKAASEVTVVGASLPPKTASPLTLWYRQPARRWLEALPVGNGRIGAMMFGGVKEERIALNESTFWSGAASTEHENPESGAAFREIRKLFQAGNYQAAVPLIPKMLGRELNYGTSLPAGDLFLSQEGLEEGVQEYRRELDLDTAVAKVSFVAHGVHYSRELVASHPDGLLVLRLTASQPRSLSFTLRYDGGSLPYRSQPSEEHPEILDFHADAREKKHSDGTCGTSLDGRCRVVSEGGIVSATAHGARVVGANAATLWIALRTNFRGAHPEALSRQDIASTQRLSWNRSLRRHLADHRNLFRRVTLELGGRAANAHPTDERLLALRRGSSDPDLAALFFQYGRYLTVAGSREDSPLPLHLQGLWNDGLAAGMGWTCDYHLDINTEQNYWISEVGNLSECGQPLFRFVASLQEPGHRTARKAYNVEHGWVCHVFSNPWGFTAPGWWTGWGLHVSGGAWIATHLWEHYRFTQDRTFLAHQGYPVLKGVAEFYLDYLYKDPTTGHLSTGPSVSPELGGEAGPGPTHDRALVFEIFSACIEASQILGVDSDFAAKLKAARNDLPPYQVGRNGQLQEWFHRDDGGETDHRHTSHLVGLFPLAQITPQETPDLARAADRSLQLRMERPGWEDVEWSAGNAICYQARLGKAEAAHQAVLNMLRSDTDLDLLTYSRGGIAGASQNIFCVDGNTSGAAGIAEMLLQSHRDELELLPALPKAWPTGKVTGLRARGGLTVDLEWRDGKLMDYQVRSKTPVSIRVRYGSTVKSIRTSASRS